MTIEKYLHFKGIPLLAKIMFDKEMVEAMIVGKTIVEYNPNSAIAGQIRETWNTIK
ncbi:MAG: hypothetical protein HC831_00935 [Chloroflexia bacterium]|nr:hypothetical protein [Chloroflexia bacterium]